MSERLQPNIEQKQETIDVSRESEANLQRLREAARNETAPDSEILASLESVAKTEAVSGSEVGVGERQNDQHHTLGVHRELKQVAYSRSMERIRSNLSAPERAFSKVIHNPAVDAVSNGVARTAARPAGILGGGLFALAGSLGLLYFASRYGFTYNYLVFIFLYIGGYFAGLLVEAVLRLIRR